MENQELISVNLFCQLHSIHISFISTLQEFNLIKATEIDNQLYLPVEDLVDLEKIMRLHNELHINPEGLHAVLYLLQKVKAMQQEITILNNRLRIYE